MLICLLFGVLCILGETEGQNCTFPCNWQNKDFTLDGNEGISFWNFSETTFIKHIVNGKNNNYECFKIVGRFLITRDPNGNLDCFVIKINNADSFTIISSDLLAHESRFTNECDVCGGPTRAFQRLSAVGTVAQNQTAPACNLPVGCIPGPRAVDPITCDDNGNIERECNEATMPPTTPPPPTTSPRTPPPRHCNHGHP